MSSENRFHSLFFALLVGTLTTAPLAGGCSADGSASPDAGDPVISARNASAGAMVRTPRPSSRTRTSTPSPAPASWTQTLAAPAWRTALVSALLDAGEEGIGLGWLLHGEILWHLQMHPGVRDSAGEDSQRRLDGQRLCPAQRTDHVSHAGQEVPGELLRLQDR
jgi:hypothetical protein